MFNVKLAILSVLIGSFFLSSCDTSQKSVNPLILFKPTFNGAMINCSSTFTHSAKQWHYTQLQFFISDIQIQIQDGKWRTPKLTKSPHQSNNSVLLGEHCEHSNVLNNINWQVSLVKNTNVTNLNRIRFTLGLPFAVNHLNPLTQESPLNIPSMFWGWQKGHKFLRLEMMTADDNWIFHLGSVGCQASSPLRAPAQSCRYPNRYTFELPLTQDNNTVVLELAALLNTLELSAQTSCQSSPNNVSCLTLVNNLTGNDKNSIFRQAKKDNHHE